MSFNQAFWKWFGQSQVVDEHGQPLVVYHGTWGDQAPRQGFNVFRTPAYFAESAEYAEFFAGKMGYMLPVYLSIKNPLDLTPLRMQIVSEEVFATVLGAQGLDESRFLDWYYTTVGPKKINAWTCVWALLHSNPESRKKFSWASDVKNAGYDGIVLYEGNFFSGRRHETKTWLAFHPNQIKSATGNDGTWDADDPDIRSNPMNTDWRDMFDRELISGRQAMLLRSIEDRLAGIVQESYGTEGTTTWAIFHDGKAREINEDGSWGAWKKSNPDERLTPIIAEVRRIHREWKGKRYGAPYILRNHWFGKGEDQDFKTIPALTDALEILLNLGVYAPWTPQVTQIWGNYNGQVIVEFDAQ